MKKNYLHEFALTQNIVKHNKKTITAKELYLELVKWGDQLAKSKENYARDLYSLYLSYFEKIEIDDYSFEPIWYDLNDLIEFDLLRPIPKKLERAVVIVRDILWEIIAFKTDIYCKVIPEYNMRLLTDGKKEILVLCCDLCNYTEDIYGKQVEIHETLYPANQDQVFMSKIHPGKP